MEFPETEEGGRLVKRFDALGVKVVPQARRWCEWQLLKWGWKGANEMTDDLLAYVRRKGRDPAAFCVWLMHSGHVSAWLPDDEYVKYKTKYADEFFRYKEYRSEHPFGPEGIEEVVQKLREKLRLRPPSVDW